MCAGEHSPAKPLLYSLYICIYCQSLTLFDKQLKYVSQEQDNTYLNSYPPTCVYADSLQFTTIARSIANASVVVIHITYGRCEIPGPPRERGNTRKIWAVFVTYFLWLTAPVRVVAFQKKTREVLSS
jgi:hypothetical protein